MFQKIYNILTEFLGESKQGYYDSSVEQYQFNCPCCKEENGGVPDGKYNLEVNLLKSKYNCWKCGDTNGTKGNLSSLIKKYGSPSLYREYKDEIVALKKARLYDIDAFSGVTFEDVAEAQTVSLPATYQKIELKDCRDRRLLEYLNKRKIDQEIIDKFNIGCTEWNGEDYNWRNRIIIPSYDRFGDLNYVVGRDFTCKSRRKYMNVDADKNQIVFQESKIDYDADITLVEGAIDCIYGPNTISLLGKVLTKDSLLFESLYNRANGKIIICLDADTLPIETKKIYNLLNFGRLRNKIWYISLSKYKDFGEIYEAEGKKGIINAIHSAKQFEEIELVY